MLTNYEKIKFLLDMGVYKGVEVRIDESRFKADVILVKEDRGMFYDRYGIEFMDEKINKYNVTSITPIPNPPKLLPVGTKVTIFNEYDNHYNDLYCIEKVLRHKGGYTIREESPNHNSFEIPARAVVPVLD